MARHQKNYQMKFTNSKQYSDNIILQKTFEFSILIIKYCDLLESHRKFAISNQLIRSGTSIGANAKEAHNSESKADFIHKMKIALKEADETEYWLFLCKNLDDYPNCDSLLDLLTEIIKLLNKIVSSSKGNSPIR